MELENLQDGSKKMKKCKNITFCHFFAFGGPCDVQKRVKVYKVYVSWKPWLYSLRRHQKKWFLSNWGRTRCNRSAQGLKMANCTSFKILTHILLCLKEIILCLFIIGKISIIYFPFLTRWNYKLFILLFLLHEEKSIEFSTLEYIYLKGIFKICNSHTLVWSIWVV